MVKWKKKWYILKDKSSNQNVLEESKVERDLGIMISSDLKWIEQVNLVVSKANRSIGIIKNVFTNLDVSSFKCLYKALIRPHLEYATRIWSPYLRKEILKLENFQKRATNMVTSLKRLSYEQMIKILGLDFLEWRRKITNWNYILNAEKA